MLASVINNPTRFDPANGKDAKQNLKERYAYVLNGMAAAGNIDADRGREGRQAPARSSRRRTSTTRWPATTAT